MLKVKQYDDDETQHMKACKLIGSGSVGGVDECSELMAAPTIALFCATFRISTQWRIFVVC